MPYSDEDFLKKLLKDFKLEGLGVDEIEDLNNQLREALEVKVSEASKISLKKLKTSAPKTLAKWRKDEKVFEEKLNEKWEKPFHLLETFLILSFEVGYTFNQEMRPVVARETDYIFDALTRLHARACRIGREILTLMRNGYAAGAEARWRSLHEIAVVSFFIEQHGTEVAKRYLHHEVVESYKASKQYQKYAVILGDDPLTSDDCEKIKESKEQLCMEFGESFRNEYGWAADVLKNKNPHFSDIEKAVNLDYFRPYYKMASHDIHSGPKGVYFNMGLSKASEDILLAGPSDFGMADPGHSTAISLLQINVALLNTRPSYQRLVILRVMSQLVDEIGAAFLDIHKSFEAQLDNKSKANHTLLAE